MVIHALHGVTVAVTHVRHGIMAVVIIGTDAIHVVVITVDVFNQETTV